MSIRINKYLAERGYGSRREADKLIKAGQVLINGKIALLGDQVTEKDNVIIKGRGQNQKPQLVYIILNKPVGYITTTDSSKKDNVMELIQHRERLFPVGRLDVSSAGLLLLTNDGALANKLTHPRYEHKKEYIVTVDKKLNPSALNKLSMGIKLKDGMTLPAKTKQLDPYKFSIIIREGRNHQIRRMCEALGYKVITLKRIRIATLKLGSLQPKEWRHLTTKEISRLI